MHEDDSDGNGDPAHREQIRYHKRWTSHLRSGLMWTIGAQTIESPSDHTGQSQVGSDVYTKKKHLPLFLFAARHLTFHTLCRIRNQMVARCHNDVSVVCMRTLWMLIVVMLYIRRPFKYDCYRPVTTYSISYARRKYIHIYIYTTNTN